jgi:hypothetical protein
MASFPAGLDIDDEDEDTPVRPATVRTTTPQVRSTVSAGRRSRPETRATDRLRTGGWDWAALRDYVIRMIEATSGAHVQRDPRTEKGIFSSFVSRHGAERAEAIARYAFETSPHPGYWLNAPIRPTRFTKGADECFAQEIIAKLR